jgi:hypothetical protein
MATLSFDFSRGVDVFQGKKLLAHFDGPYALEAAKLMAAEKLGRYVRYWRAKERRWQVTKGE